MSKPKIPHILPNREQSSTGSHGTAGSWQSKSCSLCPRGSCSSHCWQCLFSDTNSSGTSSLAVQGLLQGLEPVGAEHSQRDRLDPRGRVLLKISRIISFWGTTKKNPTIPLV